jgi:predicted double-glycine peptidase
VASGCIVTGVDMKNFTYWSNNGKCHEKMLLEVHAENVLVADEEFKKVTGIEPVKTPWVGMSVEITSVGSSIG